MQPKIPRLRADDPVELHDEIRKRLLKLKDPELPPNERISALVVEDHIVGEGQRRWDGPLVDPARNVPHSEATEKAVKALICHPQAGLRYYQRVSVTTRVRQFSLRASRSSAVPTRRSRSRHSFTWRWKGDFLPGIVLTQLPPVQHGITSSTCTRMSAGKYLTALVILDAARSFSSYLIKSQ